MMPFMKLRLHATPLTRLAFIRYVIIQMQIQIYVCICSVCNFVYCIALHCIALYRIVSYRIVFVLCRILSYSYCVVSYRIVSYRIVHCIVL